jgi:isoleucyl-tRNA synthetase
MADARSVVSLGRALRVTHDIKTRQPLRRATVVTHDATALAAIGEHRELILEELNVKELVLLEDDADLAELSFKANFKTLGKRMGKRMKEAATAVEAFTRDDWNRLSSGESIIVCDEPVTQEDVLVTRAPKGGVILESAGAITVALDITLDDALKNEGLVRELISRLQKTRKDTGLAVTDRVRVVVTCAEAGFVAAARAQSAHIADEVLATALIIEEGAVGDDALDIDGHAVGVRLERAS